MLAQTQTLIRILDVDVHSMDVSLMADITEIVAKIKFIINILNLERHIWKYAKEMYDNKMTWYKQNCCIWWPVAKVLQEWKYQTTLQKSLGKW